MSIELNHTIVPSHDKDAAARFFARIFGLSYDGPQGHFAPVRVNDSLTMDFDDASGFDRHHYAFKVSRTNLTLYSRASRTSRFHTAAVRVQPTTWRSIIGGADAGSISAIPTAICWSS